MAFGWSRVDTKRMTSPRPGLQRVPSLLPGWLHVMQVWSLPSRFIVKTCDLPSTVRGMPAFVLLGEMVTPSAPLTFAPVARSSM